MTSRPPHLAGTPLPWRVAAALACAAAGAALFQFYGNANRGYIDTASLFYWWGFQWVNPGSETEHGWMILGLSGWLFWRNLQGGAVGRARPAGETSGRGTGSPWPALAALVGGLALHALGFVAQQARLSILALLLFTWGVMALAAGSAADEAKGGPRRWGAAAAFPLAFMVFAIPINVLDSLGFWLRVWVVDASAGIAHGAGIGVLQSGTQLVAPDGSYNYDVAAACSGIRSLTAMAALAVLAGYLNFQSGWRRALVGLLCLPLAYAGNVARIVAIILAATAGGPKWGDRAHEVMGYGVFVIVLGGVLSGVALLRLFSPEADPPGGESAAAGSEAEPQTKGLGTKGSGDRDGNLTCEEQVSGLKGSSEEGRRAAPGSRWVAPWAVAGVVIGLAAGEMVWLGRIAAAPGRGEVGVALAAGGRDPVELPTFLGVEWTGRPQAVTAAEKDILPPDTGYSRKLYFNHRDPTKLVFVSIVLSGRDRTSIHRPEMCLVGQGWTIADTVSHEFRLPGSAGGALPATLLRVRREVQTRRGKEVVPQVVVYWFMDGDGVAATHGRRLARDAWNRVVHGRADRWAYVLMQTDAGDGEAAALARLQAVLNETLPVLAPQVFAAQKP